MINEKYFNKLNQVLTNILDNSILDKKEIEDKKRKLNQRLKSMVIKKEIDNHYVSLAHEIKSYDFLKEYGNLVMARDTRSERGPDFKINNCSIECVCCSSGDIQKNGLDNYRLNENVKSIVMDYNKLLEILLPRITQELVVKSKKFKEYIDDGIIQKDEPCIIFLSLGEIAQDFFAGKYGFDFLNVLVGKSHLTLKIDKDTNEVFESFYSHVDNIKKQNGSLIDANFFVDINNEHISGILFTDAYICDLYNRKNTFLFLNPYAVNNIKVKDFNNLIYWKSNNNMEYIPRYKGNNLWKKYKNII